MESSSAERWYGPALHGGFLVLIGANSFGHLPGSSLITCGRLQPRWPLSWRTLPHLSTWSGEMGWNRNVRQWCFFFFFFNLKRPHAAVILTSYDSRWRRVVLKMHKDASSSLRVNPFGCWVFSGFLVRVKCERWSPPCVCSSSRVEWRQMAHTGSQHWGESQIIGEWCLAAAPPIDANPPCSKSRGYALLFFPYAAINPVFSPVCEGCRRIPMTRLRPVCLQSWNKCSDVLGLNNNHKRHSENIK